jgi:Ca-activated chloride channel homolog
MSFIAPLAALLGLLAIPIILLYMLRLRRREVVISSNFLWAQVVRDREANAPWQKLKRNLLLLMQLLILAALVFALMRPFIEIPVITSGRIALLVDGSASMNARDEEGSRFEAAKAQASALISTLSEGDTVAVVRVVDGPEVLENYTTDRARLQAAISAMEPGSGAANWDAALTLAAAGAQGAEKFTIIIFSDGGIPPELNLAAYGDVRLIPVGKSAQNVAITALATGNNAFTENNVSTYEAQVYAQLANYGPDAVEIIFSLSLDGELFDATRYSVPARGTRDVVVTGLPADFRTVQAKLSLPSGSTQTDYLASDDEAWAVYTPVSAGQAVVLSQQNRFLERGLASLPDWRVFQSSPARGLPAQRYDLYVFDNWLPSEFPNGNILIVNPPRSTNWFSVNGVEKEATSIVDVLADDPRTRYLKFNDVNVLQFKKVSAAWAIPLVSASGGPLVLAGEIDGRRVAIITFDLIDSDFPLKIAYPILLANLTEWYKTPRAVRAAGNVQPGQAITIQPAGDSTQVVVTRPNGQTDTYPVTEPLLVYPNTSVPGLYKVQVLRDSTVLQEEAFAVNLFDPQEADITPRQPVIGDAAAGANAAGEISQLEFWSYLALAALLLLMLEWYLHHQRIGLPLPKLFRRKAAPSNVGRPTTRAGARYR